MKRRTWFIALAPVLLAGCMTAPETSQNRVGPEKEHPALGTAPKPTAQRRFGVKIYFATDRQWTGSQEQPKWYGSDSNGNGRLGYGSCWVAIPPGHVPGNIEKPSIFNLEVQEDVVHHVVVLTPVRMGESQFFTALGSDVKKA